MILWHNPRCSTSRQALLLLKENGFDPEIREYLNEAPTQKEIRELLKQLGCRAESLVRKKEPLYQEKFAGKKLSSAEWIRVLAKHPVLIERPILVDKDKAVIGRPPSLLLEFTDR